jgi:hypothetical protein
MAKLADNKKNPCEESMIRTNGLRPALPLVLAALLLSACSTQRIVQGPAGTAPARPAAAESTVMSAKVAADAELLTRMAAMQERLYQVGAPLLILNADLCKTHARNLLGFTAKNRYSYPGDLNDAARIAFGMGDKLQVNSVLSGSGAARAGLKRGDVLVAAEGKPLPTGPNAETLAATVFGPLVGTHATIKLALERSGTPMVLPVPVTRACAFRIDLGNADNVNSYADGNRVMVTRAMMNFAQSDEELALVMAKGLAHNVLGHAQAIRMSSTLGSVIDNLVNTSPDTSLLIGTGGIKAMPPEMDAAADSLALYMVARAGYNIDGAAQFWQRLATMYPITVLNGYVANHPATAIRIAAIDKTVAEIKSKQASRKVLLP